MQVEGNVRKHYVLSGMGGVGKSEIALQFADRHRQDFWGIFWIDCSTLETIHRSFAVVASRCSWGSGSGDELTRAVVRELSNARTSWLLVLDNCDDPKIDYSDFVPNASVGTLLITTRLDDARSQYGVAGSQQIDGLGETHAVELLFRTAGKPMPGPETETAAAKKIVGQLDYHTLAVTVAASLVKKRRSTFEKYSKELITKFAELLRTKGGQAKSAYETIEATFEISAQRMLNSGEKCDGHALELLDILAFFDRTDAPEEIFTRAWKWGKENRENPRECEDEAAEFDIYKLSTRHFDLALSFAWAKSADLDLFKDALARLHELSLAYLVEKSDGTTSITMHSVLHSWARNRLQGSQAWQTAAATLALSAESSSRWEHYTHQLQPHLESCYDARLQIHETPKMIGFRFLCQTLRLFWWQFYQANSERVVSVIAELQCLTDGVNMVESNSTLILRMQTLTLKASGNYVDALDIQRKLVQSHEQSDGGRHGIAVQVAKIDLADTLSNLRRHEEAARVLEGLQEFMDKLRRTDTHRVHFLCCLGSSHLLLNMPEKAASVLEGVLETLREHPSTVSLTQMLKAKHHLAKAYQELGQASKSVRMFEEVVEVESRILPPRNLDRWITEVQLANAYISNGALGKAEKILGDAFLHLDLQNAGGYAYYHFLETELLVKEENISRAEKLQECLVVQDYEALPLGNRDRFAQEYKLISYHIGTKNHEKARLRLEGMQVDTNLLCEQDRRRLDHLEKRLAWLEHELALQFYNQGSLELAIQLMEQAVRSRAKLSSPQDRHRCAAEYSLLFYYIHAKRTEQARQQLDKMLVDFDSLEEDNQEDIVKLQKDLAVLEHQTATKYYDEGRFDLAIAVQERVVEAESGLLSQEDGSRWFSVCRLLQYYVSNEDLGKARDLIGAAHLPLLNSDFFEEYTDESFHSLDLAILRQESVAQQGSEWLSLEESEWWAADCEEAFNHTRAGEHEEAEELWQSMELPLLDRSFSRLTYKLGQSWCCV